MKTISSQAVQLSRQAVTPDTFFCDSGEHGNVLLRSGELGERWNDVPKME